MDFRIVFAKKARFYSTDRINSPGSDPKDFFCSGDRTVCPISGPHISGLSTPEAVKNHPASVLVAWD
jgi:hypothetical protein